MSYKNYQKGNDAFSINDYKKALAYYSTVKFDRDNPDYATLKLRLAESYYKLGILDDAIRELKELLNFYMLKLELQKAIAVCKRILKMDPDDVEVMQTMASILTRIGQNKEAIKYYKVLILNYEYLGSIDKTLESVEILQKLGQYDADKILDLVISNYKEKIVDEFGKHIKKLVKELNKANETDFLSIAYSFSLAYGNVNNDILKEMIKLYFYSGNIERALSLSLYGISFDKKEKFYRVFLFKSLLALGYKDDAIDVIKYRVLNLDKKELKGLEGILKSIKRMSVRLPEEVYDDEKTVIVSAPRQEYAKEFNDAKILVAEGLLDDALDILSNLLVKYPDDDVVRQYFREVSSQFTKNTKLTFKDKSTDEAYKELKELLGDVKEQELTERIQALDEVLKLSLGSYTLYQIGTALIVMELWTYGEKIFKKLRKQETKNSELFNEAYILENYCGAMASIDPKSYVDNLRNFAKKTKEKKFKLSALYHLGNTLEILGNKNDAISIYKEISSIAPNYRDVDIRLASISR